jgi:hypothetical protein
MINCSYCYQDITKQIKQKCFVKYDFFFFTCPFCKHIMEAQHIFPDEIMVQKRRLYSENRI